MYSKIFKNIVILLFCIILFHPMIYAQEHTPNLFPRTTLDFCILESELSEENYVVGDMYDLGFIEYDNKKISNSRPIHDRMITLRSEFTIDSIYSTQDLYLVVLPVDYPCKIYINGDQLFIRGNYKNGYTNRMHCSENILLPPYKINYNDKNEIAFQLYPKEGESHPLGQVFISNSQDATKYVFYRNLLGTKLIFALSLCSFVFFVFFLIIYITRREYQKQYSLFFAFMNLFFIISFINNIFSYNFSNTFLLEKIARAGFPILIFVGICFLLEYTNVFKKKKIIKVVLLLVYLPAMIMVLIPGTTTEAIKAYNSYPLISLFFGTFLLFIITLLYFLKEKGLKSTLLLIIYLLNMIASLHDGYYFAVLKVKPFLLLTPNTLFGINLIIFFILAVDHSKLYHVALDSSKKLEKLNQELELLVEKRTQKTIEYANKLEEANKTKDKFFSIIAHDLKNPFNTLIGYSDVLKSDFREYGQDEIYEQLNIIYNTSVNGYALLENLLKWSQSQTDKIVFDPVKVNLHEIIQMCIDDVEHQCLFKDIDIINDVPKNNHIIADKNLLKTILRNLISNAVKFTLRNGMVSISSNKDDKATEISVKDTGVGLSESELQNLFKIDKIYSKPGTNKEKGSGLGLILCKEFVEKHGGKIWVESELETGSVFKFTIPKIIQMN
ncbi:MAG: HAMP domain-containing histidine kinase [Bacteroidales bacterium]|nr:HAMP domain-containing histidine kinase [Bacteroidales bacterium]